MKHVYLLLLFLSHFTNSSAQEKSITVGSGGGFTGGATVYKLMLDGKVFKGQGIGEIKYTECGKLKKKVVKKYFNNALKEIQSITAFNHPGNLYHFLSYNTGSSTEQKVTWGDLDYAVPEAIQKLYQDINAALKSVRFKPIH